MTIITVNAERSYPVTITNSWSKDLAAIFEGRTRVAVIVSASYSPDLAGLRDLDSDCHVSVSYTHLTLPTKRIV